MISEWQFASVVLFHHMKPMFPVRALIEKYREGQYVFVNLEKAYVRVQNRSQE